MKMTAAKLTFRQKKREIEQMLVYCQTQIPDCLLGLQDTLMEGVKHYFGGGAAAMNLHERIADLLLMQLSFSMEDPGQSF